MVIKRLVTGSEICVLCSKQNTLKDFEAVLNSTDDKSSLMLTNVCKIHLLAVIKLAQKGRNI